MDTRRKAGEDSIPFQWENCNRRYREGRLRASWLFITLIFPEDKRLKNKRKKDRCLKLLLRAGRMYMEISNTYKALEDSYPILKTISCLFFHFKGNKTNNMLRKGKSSSRIWCMCCHFIRGRVTNKLWPSILPIRSEWSLRILHTQYYLFKIIFFIWKPVSIIWLVFILIVLFLQTGRKQFSTWKVR